MDIIGLLFYLVPALVGFAAGLTSKRFVCVPIAVAVLLALLGIGLLTGVITGDSDTGGDYTPMGSAIFAAIVLGPFVAAGAFVGVCLGKARTRWAVARDARPAFMPRRFR